MALEDAFEGVGEVVRELGPLRAPSSLARSLGSKADLHTTASVRKINKHEPATSLRQIPLSARILALLSSL